MKLTRDQIRTIRKAARETIISGRLDRVEIGMRYCTGQRPADPGTMVFGRETEWVACEQHSRGEGVANLELLDGCDTDLSDFAALTDEIEDGPDGRVQLDLYVYNVTGRGDWADGGLSHNLTVKIEAGVMKILDGYSEVPV